MDVRLYFTTIFLLLGSFSLFSQEDLRNLRALPDTSITGHQEKPPLSIRNINVPIPQLGLEVDYWKHWSKFGINVNQSTFSENWSAGGVNSFSWASTIWHKSEYNKNNFNFTTELDLKYGRLRNGKISEKDLISRKNVDRIFWDNKLSYKLSKNWAIYTSFTWETIFDVGYNYGKDSRGRDSITNTISAFMAPGYFTESFGLEYKPDNSFSLRFGTGTARQTIILDDRIKSDTETVYGVEPGKSFRNELAFQLTANLDRNLSPNLNLKSRYNLFADYEDISDPDHRLDVTLTAKVTKLVSVTLNGVMLYDSEHVFEEKKAGIQYSQSLALGLLFSLPR